MKTNFYFLLILSFCFTLSFSKLISVIEVNRHGARSSENFPEAPLQQFFGISMKLTNNGYRQHQLLGSYMNARYVKTNFINSVYRPSDFQIISTPTQRTVYSADGFISGLYPGHVVRATYHEPNLNLISNDTIPVIDPPSNYKEIPLTVLSWVENSIFNSWNCKLNGEILKPKSENKTTYPDLLPITDEEMTFAAKYLANFFNITEIVNDFEPRAFMKQVNKYIITYFYHFGLKMEEILPSKVVEVVKKMYVNKWYSSRIEDSQLLKLGASELFEKINEIFTKAVNSRKNFLKPKIGNTKYTVYSSHDTAIVNIISNLLDGEYLRKIVNTAVDNQSSYDFLVPPFASNVLFELHFSREKQQYYVMVLYNGRVINHTLRGMNKSYDDGKIPLEDFMKFMKSRIDEDYKRLDCSEAIKEERLKMFPILKKKQSKNKLKGAQDAELMSSLLSLNKLVYDN